ncbi:hypothetical protein CC78DRAFT_543850 [Lojkania enalia]|uniref:Uncharacterized protein n=1 Tax=Lojkania enalia TaxID=147567 RepID=A0A9P4KBU7_9PLEO|nr:hypothetical protein CC78DRAFT_543850 [Didymosphaeria enalia]
MVTVQSLKALTLDLPPSCVEFWPLNPQYAVVGTYNLEKTLPDEKVNDVSNLPNVNSKQTQSRNGSLILLLIDGDDVKLIDTLPTKSANLDLHFCPPHYSASRFGVATSTGSIEIYAITDSQNSEVTGRLSDKNSTLHLTFLDTKQFWDEQLLVTSFTFHPNKDILFVTLTSGAVCSVILENDSSPGSIRVIKHDLEAWTVAFTSDGSGAYSGGDDSALRYSQMPIELTDLYDNSKPDRMEHGTSSLIGWADKRTHGAGVTAILPLRTDVQSDLVVTGSYDDHIRLLHAPYIGRRTVLTEENLGGGVWRLKCLDCDLNVPENKEGTIVALILASCMHAGARILKLVKHGDDNWRFEVVAKFEEHTSMNYGSDCQPFLAPDGKRTFISTSFYDRLLCLWRY